jgi:choline-sulfatase
VPSRTSFLTGRQPSDTRVWINSDTLSSAIPTFAHAFGAAGYETALIGRMHFNGPDQHHGFDKRLVGDLTPAYSNVKIPLAPNLLPGATNNSRASVTIAGPGRTAYRSFDEEVTQVTVGYLRNAAKSSRPFCAVAGFVLPHSPFVCSREDFDYYHERVTVPHVSQDYLEHLHPAVQAWRKRRGVENLSDEEVRRARAAYYGLVTETDRHVGSILGALKDSGLEQDTIVVYTSDHGEMAGENGMWWKFNFYQGSVTVPLIVSFPGRWRAGARISNVVSLIDIAPTVCEAAGVPPLPMATGRSLAPLLSGAKPDWPNEAFSELPTINGVPAARMVRKDRWKLVHFHGMRPQLFDLHTDPQELHDLGEAPAQRSIREQLLARATANWHAEEIDRELQDRAKDEALIHKWAVKTNPKDSQLWTAPAGANVFPEPK